MKLKKYQTYISSLFIKKLLLISFIFFCLVFIINIFEEIRFAEKYNTDIFYTLYLSFLNAPSLLFEVYPFIFLISVMFFYLSLREKNEIEILNSNGISQFKIILFLTILTLLIGTFLLLFFYSFSSNLKNKYLETKNRFSNNNEYLAIVKSDGLWIKEENEQYIYIIHAEKFDEKNLKFVTITETDKYFKLNITIKAETANIISKNWQLFNATILDNEGKIKKFKSYVYNSSFKGEIISNLFSNLNSLNIYELHKLSIDYLKIGYSNTDIKIHLNKLYSLPFYFILMTVLGFIIISKLKIIKSTFFVIIFGIFISVLVYYLNYFSSVLGTNGVLPIYLSVWTPLFILFLLCNIGILKINEN